MIKSLLLSHTPVEKPAITNTDVLLSQLSPPPHGQNSTPSLSQQHYPKTSEVDGCWITDCHDKQEAVNEGWPPVVYVPPPTTLEPHTIAYFSHSCTLCTPITPPSAISGQACWWHHCPCLIKYYDEASCCATTDIIVHREQPSINNATINYLRLETNFFSIINSSSDHMPQTAQQDESLHLLLKTVTLTTTITVWCPTFCTKHRLECGQQVGKLDRSWWLLLPKPERRRQRIFKKHWALVLLCHK